MIRSKFLCHRDAILQTEGEALRQEALLREGLRQGETAVAAAVLVLRGTPDAAQQKQRLQ